MVRFDPSEQIDPDLLLTDVLTADELVLLGVPPFGLGGQGYPGIATSEEDFRLNALDMYGEDWINHAPTKINGAFKYLFDCILFPRTQLPIWHSPIDDIQLHGARGSAKTFGMALIGALYGALYPGNDVLHLSLSKDQVALARDIVEQYGGARRHNMGAPYGIRNFMRLFSVRSVGSPQAEINLRSWDDDDPGTAIMYRSVGNVIGARIRSIRAGAILFDEALREYDDDWHIRVVAGCRLGANNWKLNKMPEVKAQYEAYIEQLSYAFTAEEQEAIKEKTDALIEDNDAERKGSLVVYGNVGPEEWMWQRYEEGVENSFRWSVTWESKDNPATTKKQIEALVRQFGDDDEASDMEVKAKRPPPRSDTFTLQHRKGLLDLNYSARVRQEYEDGTPGYLYETLERHGLYRFAVPPVPGAVYAGAGDPGNDHAPGRNSWCVFVVRIDQIPFEMAYFEWGNFKGVPGHIKGSIKPWLRCVYKVIQTYPMLPDHFAAEASSTQRNIHEIAWDSELFWKDLGGARVTRQRLAVKPLSMSVVKPLLRNKLTLMLTQDGGLFHFPHIKGLARQMNNYKASEDKPTSRLAQDLIQGLFALADVTWEYAVTIIYPPEPEETAPEVYSAQWERETRSTFRDVGRVAR